MHALKATAWGGLSLAVVAGVVTVGGNKGKNNLYRARVFTAVCVAGLWASVAMAATPPHDGRGITVPQDIPNFGTDPLQRAFRPEGMAAEGQNPAPLAVEETFRASPPLLSLPSIGTASEAPQQVAILPDEQTYFSQKNTRTHGAPLEGIRLVLDMQNVTIRQALDHILADAAPQTGPWTVRWQLAEDNRYLLNEPMNITAETTLDEFLAFMTEKVVNMSGVKLNAKVFNMGRVIVISDTY